jgi:hypothetical protein
LLFSILYNKVGQLQGAPKGDHVQISIHQKPM